MGVTINGSNFGGGTIEAGQTASGTGTITATTNDGLLEVTPGGSLEVNGSLSGSGVAEIGDGGTLQVDGGLNGGNVVFDPSAHPQTLIVGQGTSAATLVANTGSGVLEITQSGSSGPLGGGGAVLDLGASANQGGLLSVGTGSSFTESGEIILGDAGSGSLAVAGLLNAGTNNVVVGNLGSGAITISAGGTVIAGTSNGDLPAVDIGEQAGGSGTVVVSGSLSASGQVNVGDAGMGALVVEQGGTVHSGGNARQPGGGISIGFDTGGEGDVTVTGPGSTLNNVGQFTVGGNTVDSLVPADLGTGLGTLRILNGATVITNPGTGYSGPAADIGAASGADGSSVTVTGTNSTWNVGGTLVVGDGATGSLGVSAGGTVDATDLVIGNQSTASGNVALSGTGSSITLSGTNAGDGLLTVGGAGVGDLSIANGATLTASSAQVGSAGGSGDIDLEGHGSYLHVTGNMAITNGDVVVGAGSTLNVAGALSHTATGILQILGGVVDPTTYDNTGTLGPNGTFVATDSLINTGTILGQAGTMLVSSPTITDGGGGGGTLDVAGGGNLFVNAGTIDNSQTVTFKNGTSFGVLTIGSLDGFGAVISNFNTHAEIVLQSVSIASDGNGNVSSVTYGSITPIASTQIVSGGIASDGDDALLLYSGPGNTGSVIGTLDLGSSLTTAQRNELETVNADGGLGAMPCFTEGTLIRTTRGDVPVEELREGDLVPTELGGAAAPVVWIGRRSVDCARHPEPRKVWPVRVRAGAFGPRRPARDLWLSPDHAVFFEGVLIPVKYLINGAAIAQVPMDRVTYYHVELPRHDVILAEGLPTESFLDTGGKCMFENGSAPMMLHPDFAILQWEAEGCAPLVVTGPEVAAARRRLARAA